MEKSRPNLEETLAKSELEHKRGNFAGVGCFVPEEHRQRVVNVPSYGVAKRECYKLER